MPKHVFVTEKEAMKDDFKGRTNYWLCRPDIVETTGLLTCRVCLPPGEGHDFHRHPELEEVIYVLSGEVEQWVELEMRVLRPGELAHIPRGVVHATFNVSAEDAVILAILTPAAPLGPFVVDVSAEEPWKSVRSH
jgi:quercetin dioxygenase-like cupin family protein